MASESIVDALNARPLVVAAELRPPRAELSAVAGIAAWIDTYHAIRGLTRRDLFVCLTDSAVGSQEEDNLRHLVTNLGDAVDRRRIVPFLTSKHSLPPRCVPHAWQLREAIRGRQPDLALGGWANPHADPVEQVAYLTGDHAHADFYLTQIVSHHERRQVAAFLNEAERRRLALHGMFGVFYYRSANPRTLDLLRGFMPVPVEALTAEFDAGASATEVCGRTVRALIDEGVHAFYVSNLPLGRAQATLGAILEHAGVGVPAR
jgi:hypothetical protein